MAKATALALAASSMVALSAACSDAPTGLARSVPRTDEVAPKGGTVGYGWSRPITKTNFSAVAATKLGKAESMLAGNSLRDIVTSANVRVRGDDRACSSCHAWAVDMTRAGFCARVPDFIAMPTAKGDGTDPENAKPALLKQLLERWYDDECPE